MRQFHLHKPCSPSPPSPQRTLPLDPRRPSPFQLLNTTVASMAIMINTVLTACYHAVFGDSLGRTDSDELMLMTAPLSAASEVQGLYEKGVIDFESAIPAALHSLGCSANEISEALSRRRSMSKSDEAADESNEVDDAERALKVAQAEHTRAHTSLIQAQTKRVQDGSNVDDTSQGKEDESTPLASKGKAAASAKA